MQSRRSIASRFKSGYLPFTTGALALLFAWPVLINRGSGLPGAGFVLMVWALSVAITQLSILLVPYPDPKDFRPLCWALTAASLVLGPFGIVLLVIAASVLALRRAWQRWRELLCTGSGAGRS
ncbi:MAG TPA: hypothetical protein VFN09_12580 [Rhodanobacteraceae bacterium]|nr:hypothetical protein [Rhodanobacteraceae bacterium]